MEVINNEVEFEEKAGTKPAAKAPAQSPPKAEPMKRFTAVKMRIGEITSGAPVIENERFKFIKTLQGEVSRVNIVANVIDKYISDGENKFGSLTLDDASGQIRARAFGDDVGKFFSNVTQGDAVVIIGLLRYFNNEVYITPDIVKLIDSSYLLIRKFETENEKVLDKKELFELKDRIIDFIKNNDVGFGIENEALFKQMGDAEVVKQEIKKLLEEGMIYESRPGVLRYLG